MYNMIFAPFTGKDNHGKIVTFVAGLLTREDVESYEWILNNFKRCIILTRKLKLNPRSLIPKTL